MGRTRGKKTAAKPIQVETAAAAAPQPEAASVQQYSADELVSKAEDLVESYQFDLALQFCLRALEGEPQHAQALETAATVELELGLVEEAHQHLITATSLPEPQPTAFLYLSQLTEPEQSLQCFQAALTIFKARLQSMQVDVAAPVHNGKEKAWSVPEAEARRSASRALIGMTELYLTELCMEEDAEQKCEAYLQEALLLDPTDSEVYQTLASVRLSQQRNQEAVQNLHQAWNAWKQLDDDNVNMPPFHSRISLAKLLVEATQLLSALELLSNLEQEDDENIQVQYLLGLAWNLLAQSRREGTDVLSQEQISSGSVGTSETAEEAGEEARDALLNCLRLYGKLDSEDQEPEDEEMLEHIQKLLQGLKDAGVPDPPIEVPGQKLEGGDDWEDMSDVDGRNEDTEMA